jgi:hypothetical protein
MKFKKIIIIVSLIFVFFLGVLFFDHALPTNKIETTVHHVDKSNRAIIYNVSLSGGGVESCSVDDGIIAKLHPNCPIVIETTAILGKCKATLPSWPVEADKLIKVAVRYASYGNYANIEQLRKDYPGFTPRIRLWGEDHWFMPVSFRRYSVQMPKKLVIFDSDGNFLTTRDCGTVGGDCKPVTPVHPERGMVGTVQ